MAAGRGRRLLLLLLPGALLAILPLATPHPSVTHRYENVKVVEISVEPTAAQEVASEGKEIVEIQQLSNTGEIAGKNEEQTLNDLVNLLQDVVKNIPTELVLSTEQPPTPLLPEIVTSPSVAVDTVWVNVNPQNSEKTRTIALMKNTPTTTAFWKLRNDASASVILHSHPSPSGNLPSEASESVVLISEEANPGSTLGTISVQVEKETTTKEEGKSFDQLTNGALASLVESLKNVQNLHKTDHNEPQQKSHPVKLAHHKSRGLDILEAIDTLIKTIKNAPPSVKEDPALHEYVDQAEGYLKNALELAGEAERKLLQKKEQEMKLDIELLNPPSTAPPITEMELEIELPPSLSSQASEGEINLDINIAPSPSTVPHATQMEIEIPPSPSSTAVPVSGVEIVLPASESPKKKAEDAEKEMGKLKGFINLLYGFSPELTEFAENSPHKKMAQDIVDRSMEVLDAIKSVFCGNPKKQSQQVLKQLLKKDMELVRQAMKEKRAS